MKNASPATLAILSGGLYFKVDLYIITLTTGVSYYFTSGETPIGCAIYPSATNNSYVTGMTITRGSTTQTVGLNAQEMDLEFWPQFDSPGGPPLIAGYNILTAARLGILDNALVQYAKLFSNTPLTTSQGAVAWFEGLVQEMDVDRDHLMMKVSCDLVTINQVQMPKNLYQSTCTHTLYDAGCTLSKSAFTVSGTVTAVTSASNFNTNLTQAINYFSLGVLTFTSGANNGFQTTVKQYLQASGNIQTLIPYPAAVAVGDTFNIYPGCDHLQATCSGKFSNLAHFKATPYVPVPETLYDGGTSSANTSASEIASGGTGGPGSGPSGRTNPR